MFTNIIKLLEDIAISRYNNPEQFEQLLTNQLSIFSRELSNISPSQQEQLKQEFYQWIIATRVNYSQQVSEQPTRSRIGCKFSRSACFSNGSCGDFKSNNGKGSKVCLRNEIEKVNEELGRKVDELSREIEKKIEISPKQEFLC